MNFRLPSLSEAKARTRAAADRMRSQWDDEPPEGAEQGDAVGGDADERLETGMGSGDWAFWTGLVVVVLSIVSALATYLILTGLSPIPPRNEVVLVALLINILLIIAMFAVLSVQALGLWRAWQRKVAGARIHVRIVGLFTLIAAAPALLLALAATVSFSRSLDSWFSNRTRTIVASSLDVARAYLQEHGQVIRTDVVNMAKDLDDVGKSLAGPDLGNSVELRNLLIAQAGLRDLSIAALIDDRGNIKLEGASDTRVVYQPPTPQIIAQARAGNVAILLPHDSYRVAAVTRLALFPDTYLYVARAVNPKVVGHLRRTEAAVAEYERLRAARGPLRLVHGVMYFMISLTGILAAIWVGLWFARHLVAPIRRLIGAAQRVAQGDLSVELPLRRGEGDLRRLSRDFNLMTRELSRQHTDLTTANDQLSERRRFMEAVLSGVSAGVIGLDAEGRVRLANSSAERFLGRSSEQLVGTRLGEVVPELAVVVEGGGETTGRSAHQAQTTFLVGDEERTFNVRVTHEQASARVGGSVVTFDDVTELIAAQRSSAWGDVARRIAHEIKNPLTPIQLSAERIRRKYAASITNDRATFEKLTDTIVRQVGDIKTMVDEFAAFARIPKPSMEMADVRDIVQEPVILFRESHPAVTYQMTLPDTPVTLICDARLVTQALTNLVKNATESIETFSEQADRPQNWKGEVHAVVRHDEHEAVIEIIDNGMGLPKQNRSKLLEPYVTTKGRKGTGLGLAIVQKIVEQHGGRLTMEDAPEVVNGRRGALVRLVLPRKASPGATEGFVEGDGRAARQNDQQSA
ncbi:MAG: PAS domain-containing sensor histidine kinase [Hyphomicrobiaceae bacterium]